MKPTKRKFTFELVGSRIILLEYDNTGGKLVYYYEPMESTMPKNGKGATSPKLDYLVACYVEIRNEIKKIEDKHKKELERWLKGKERITAELLTGLDVTGQEMARTRMGTVSAAVRDTASCSDPNIFITYVRENDAYELLDRRPNGTACKAFAKEHGQLPPGVKVSSQRYVNVRAPTQPEELEE